MIKIELDNTIKEKNIYLHKQYIKELVLGKLEKYLGENRKTFTNSLDDQYCTFLKDFLGQKKQKRIKGVLVLCISDDLEGIVDKYESFVEHVRCKRA